MNFKDQSSLSLASRVIKDALFSIKGFFFTWRPGSLFLSLTQLWHSPKLKGAATSQRDIIHEEYESRCILHLTCLTDLLKLVFPGVMDTILYSYPPLWNRKELLYFPIKPSRRRSITIVLRHIFQRGLNWKNFLTLAEWSINKSTGSPSHGLGLCIF